MTYTSDDVRVLLRQIDSLKDQLAETKSRADAAKRADAASAENRRKQVTAAISDEAHNRQRASIHADSVEPAYSFHGMELPKIRQSEHAENYRRRLLSGLQKYADGFETLDLYSQPEKNVDILGREIIQAALDPASHKVDVLPGTLKGIRKVTPTGNVEQRFVGVDGYTFIHQLNEQWPRRYVAREFGSHPLSKYFQ